MKTIAPLATLLAALAPLAWAIDGQPEQTSDETGGPAWEAGAHGVVVRVAQISPDQARAFYLARGFDAASAEQIARVCVFQTILRNQSESPIRFHLADWRAVTPSQAIAPRVDADWQVEWEARAVPASARTAFRWALFPSEQSYEPGDWNMGMTMYSLPPGSRFDLRVVWRAGESRHEVSMKGVECATDNEVRRPDQ